MGADTPQGAATLQRALSCFSRPKSCSRFDEELAVLGATLPLRLLFPRANLRSILSDHFPMPSNGRALKSTLRHKVNDLGISMPSRRNRVLSLNNGFATLDSD